MLPNFVLTGFMGCGKSTVGRRLAAITGHRFVDSDELIVKTQNKSIPEIFAEVGEEAFRDIEQALALWEDFKRRKTGIRRGR